MLSFGHVKQQFNQKWASLGAMLCLAISQARADVDVVAELDDAAARSQYAFYTTDTRNLEEVIGLIEQLAAPPPLQAMKAYYAAVANWKLAQLRQEENADASGADPEASQAGKACRQHAEAAAKQDSDLAEALALQAICATFETSLTGARIGCARSKLLRAARERAPTNPRILLIEVLCTEDEERTSAAYHERVRALVRSFESAPVATLGTPDWGAAEALVLLAQSYQQRGDQVNARDTVERALVIAPDYRKAQALLSKAAARP